MTIKYVVLGYISWRPMNGPALKKKIAHSEALPWSANDNQVYQALVDLHQADWVAKTGTEYAITAAGTAALQAWVTTPPQAPLPQNPFLHQLLWADGLDASALDELLDAYLNEVGGKLFFLRVQADEKPDGPGRTPREALLWQMMYKNWIAHYELELKWVRHLRDQLADLAAQRRWVRS